MVAGLVEDAGFDPVDTGAAADSTILEAPRRAGAVYGEIPVSGGARGRRRGSRRAADPADAGLLSARLEHHPCDLLRVVPHRHVPAAAAASTCRAVREHAPGARRLAGVDQQAVAVAPGDRGRAGRALARGSQSGASSRGQKRRAPSRTFATPLDEVVGRDPPRPRGRVRGQRGAQDRGCARASRATGSRTRAMPRVATSTARAYVPSRPDGEADRRQRAHRPHRPRLAPAPARRRRRASCRPRAGARARARRRTPPRSARGPRRSCGPWRRGAEARQVERDHLALAREQRHDRPPDHRWPSRADGGAAAAGRSRCGSRRSESTIAGTLPR